MAIHSTEPEPMTQPLGGESLLSASEESTLATRLRTQCAGLDPSNPLRSDLTGAAALLERWAAYRIEIQEMEGQMAGLARKFLDLNAYEDAAKCAVKADGLKFVRGRMPTAD